MPGDNPWIRYTVTLDAVATDEQLLQLHQRVQCTCVHRLESEYEAPIAGCVAEHPIGRYPGTGMRRRRGPEEQTLQPRLSSSAISRGRARTCHAECSVQGLIVRIARPAPLCHPSRSTSALVGCPTSTRTDTTLGVDRALNARRIALGGLP